MLFTALARILKTAVISLWRNRWLSLAATLIMVITLLIISIFISLTVITNRVTAKIEDKIDMVAYIKEEASDSQIFALKKMLLNRSDVATVNYVSKEEALKRWKESNRLRETIRDVITAEDNPLPRSLEIKTNEPEQMEALAEVLNSQDYAPLIEKLSYTENKQMINRLIRFANFIKLTGLVLSIIFVMISILIIYNTIRLTIFARSDEIEIMRLVGATDWYIRGPFIFEGIAYAILATFIASILIFFAFRLTVPMAENYLGDFDIGKGYLGVNFALVVLMQFGVSVILGMACSALAIKKYLK